MGDGLIFICYRRDDAAGYARAIYDRVVQYFSKDRVFMDVDAIEPGLPFDEAIEKAIGQCQVLLVVIGRNWLAFQAEAGPRINDPKDFVRREIAAALSRNIRVIPVLLDGTKMPTEEQLPENVRAMAKRSGIEISHTTFKSDVEGLIFATKKALGEPAVPPRAPGRRSAVYWLVGAIALIALVLIYFRFYPPSPVPTLPAETDSKSFPKPIKLSTPIPAAPPDRSPSHVAESASSELNGPTNTDIDAASTNRDKPTWLTTNEIRGSGVGEDISYYYTFNAGPGVVKVTVDGKAKGGGQGPHIEISDLDAKELLDVLINYPGQFEQRAVERFQLGRRQQVILRILLSSRTTDYVVRLEGAIDLTPTAQTQGPH
jgi:hypothetical protein